MDVERWQLLKRLLAEVSELAPEERRGFLDARCGGDAELRAELEKLIDSAGVDTRELLPEQHSRAPTVIDVQPPAGSSLVPDRVAVYRVGRELGRGGMGVVHAAVDERTGREVALKLLHRGLLGSERAVARFLREAAAGSKVRHENVVRTLEAGTDEINGHQLRWLALELVEGRSLGEMLADYGPLPEALVREIARQAAAGLAAIHAAGIVHRDLKPANILVTSDQRVRLTDLGIAKVLEASEGLTHDGQFIGTLRYAAPEQFEGTEIGPAADLYSLGVVLYELATGCNPFDQDAPAAVLRAQAELEPQPAAELRPELSPFFSEFVRTLMQKRPANRFASAQVVQRVLAEAEGAAWWRDRESELRLRRAALPVVPVTRATGLHGRDAELACLRELWRGVQAGQGAAVLVEGEAGLGKSRLVDEFLRGLGAADCHVLYGSSPPSSGLRGLSEALIGKFGAAGLRAELRRRLGEGSQWGDALADVVLRDEAPEARWLGSRDTVNLAAAALLESLAAERPTVWVLEDLHFAPEEGWGLASSLGLAAGRCAALVILTSRPLSGEVGVPALAHLEQLHRLSLERLDRDALHEMVREALEDEPLADEVAERLERRSEGVPLFAFELLRARRGGAAARELPESVRQLISARLAALTREQRDLLDVAAVEGNEFDPALLANVLEQPRIRVLQELADLDRSHCLVRSAGSRFRFDHHLVLEVLYSSLAPALRREYHSLLAEALEREAVDQTRSGRLSHRLARHHVRGSRPERVREHLESACSHLESRNLTHGLLDLIERSLDPAAGFSGRDRFELLQRKFAVAEKLGRRELQGEATEECLRIADELDDPRLRSTALSAQASLLWRIAREAEAEEIAQQATEEARRAQDRRLELRAQVILGVALSRQGRFAEAEAIQRWCHERAMEIEELDVAQVALINLGQACIHQSRYQEAKEHLEHGLALARQAGSPENEASCAGALGTTHWHLGQLDESATYHELQRSISRKIGDLRYEGIATGSLALNTMERGRLEQALELFRREEALYERVQDRRGVPLSQANQAYALYLCGAIEEARAALERALPVAETIPYRRLVGHLELRFGLLAEANERPEEAEAAHRRGIGILREVRDTDAAAEGLIYLGRLLTCTGREDEAADLFDEAAALVENVEGPRNLVVARCYRAALPGGAVDEARGLLEKQADRLGHFGRLESWWALHLATGESFALAEAQRHLESVVEGVAAEYRRSTVERVPLHAAIRAAADRR